MPSLASLFASPALAAAGRFSRRCALLALAAGPALAAAPAPVTLDDLIDVLRQQNPQIEQLRQLQVAAQAAVPQALASANPQVGFIQNPIPSSPFRFGASEGFSYTLTQPFQFPGKKRLAADIAQDQADIAGTQVDALRVQLIGQLRATFYQLLALRHQERINAENIQRLEQIKKISKIRYANNAAAYVDYLNAQVAQSSAENDLFALRRQIETTRQTLNALVGRDPATPLEVRGEIPALASSIRTLGEFNDLALRLNPQLRGSELQIKAAEKGVEYAKKAYLPDFQIIATAISNKPPWGTSTDTYGMEFDVILPTWFFQKEKAGVDQARANLIASRANDTANRQQILLGVASAYNTLEQARQQVAFLRDRQLPQAQAAWRLAIQNYANNGQAFSDLLLAQVNLRGAELGLLQAESAAVQSWASLVAAVGAEADSFELVSH